MVTKIQFPKVGQDYFPFNGGLDLVTPAISIEPGKVISSQNYEPAISGGYRRIDGYERYSGLPSPTAKSYWLLNVTLTGAVVVGNTITGASSGAAGVVLGNFNGYFVLGAVTGNFMANETINVGGSGVGQATALQSQNGSPVPSNHADYLLLVANYQRQFILAVPGSGGITGVFVYNGIVYAFRNNVAGTANLMYQATPAGWSLVPFGNEIHIATLNYAGTVTMTVASPTVVTWAAHGFQNNQPVQFSISAGGTLPTGISAGITYYTTAVTANTFQLLTVAGVAVNVTGAGSGAITGVAIGNTISAGQTVTGKTSGATATVAAALLMTGTWTTALVGTLVLSGTTGTFQNGEALMVGGIMLSSSSSTAAAIVRQACTKMNFATYNFSGATGQTRLYGADSVNTAFEFDGTNYVPIHTGMTADNPTNVLGYAGYLWLSFGSSVQYSGLGAPYAWSIVLGAGQFLLSDTVTGFLPQKGTIYGNALAIFTAYRTFILYGSTNANFNLVPSIYDVGIYQSTMQMVSNDGYGLTSRGIQSLITTLNYGNFDYASISHMIQPLITMKIGLQTASNTIRSKNQYRVYFSDGTALVVGLTGDKVSGILALNYQLPVTCICTTTLPSGQEVTYFGSTNGFVYQDNVGTSQDGNPIEAWVRLPFNADKSPRYRKRWRRAVFELAVDAFSHVNVAYDLGYGNPMVQPSAPIADTVLTGQGGYWDNVNWDQFTWDSQIVSNPSLSITGTEKNIGLLFYSNRAQDNAHTLQGVTLISSVRLLERN